MTLAITAMTAVSALGAGVAAHRAALAGRRSGLRPCTFADIPFGHVGRVDELDVHNLPRSLALYDCRNNRLADLALLADGFAGAVAGAVARHGAGRIAVILGTSTSGVLSSEEAYRRRDRHTGALPEDYDFEHTHDLFSLARYVRAALRLRGPALVVSTACASSAKTFADAAQFIAAGICDAAVVGGADTLCRLTLRGFAALELISPTPCRPCDAARDGISIGEAAGFALLERPGRGEAAAFLLGHGTSSDAHHMSAPHPQGAGAIRAMRDALARAGLAPGEVDYVNLHGTGTRANDAMEDVAVQAVFGDGVPCSSTKGWTGHTLGSAGILEAVIAGICLEDGLIPGCLGVGEVDPTFGARIVTANTPARLGRVMSNSFGFGGINCSLVLGGG